ncbi:hypothetical protein, partial [Enterobacter chuandaensis]|uniref:hypothetical protein n=1 Tax=Enterobacter chuandaensis TaxID=2497875 RepID=UPI001C4E5E1A
DKSYNVSTASITTTYEAVNIELKQSSCKLVYRLSKYVRKMLGLILKGSCGSYAFKLVTPRNYPDYFNDST